MSQIVKAKSFCNNEVAYLLWACDARIEGLLGFSIVRVHHGTNERRLLPSWVAFEGQSNTNWEPQDTSVWPIQKFAWRDLTLRRSRDQITFRSPFTCHYEITPVGLGSAGRQSMEDWRAENPDVFSSADPTKYAGPRRPLFICGNTFQTNPISITSEFGDFQAVFTNGILSTQNLRKQLQTPAEQKPDAKILRTHTKAPGDAIRTFLTGDCLPTIKGFVAALEPTDHLYAALYELTDTELIDILRGLGPRLHLILSTAGSPGRNNTVWDKENHDARIALHATAGEMHDRLFNNTSRIGHNKFLVRVGADGLPKALLSGSTNWTDTGLCTQSNNVIVSKSLDLSHAYFAFWQRLKDDTATFPIQADSGAPNNNVQQMPLRAADAQAFVAHDLEPGVAARLWCSPNTAATSKTANSPAPVDLNDVFGLMRRAKSAILFLTFMPSQEGKQSIVDAAIELGKENPDLFVVGAISDPEAMPNYVPAPKTAPGAQKLPAPAIFSPEGVPEVLTIRAAALVGNYGDMEPELLSAGIAIIHDKIVVIDPLSPDCVVVTGSHNLGYKASYCNDDNLLIIENNRALAEAYAVHVLDVYEHYRFRAIEEQRERERLLAGGPAVDPEAPKGGFLSTSDTWQDGYLNGKKGPELRVFL